MVTGRLRQRSWETPETDKRSITEIEADEVGASSSGPPHSHGRSSYWGNCLWPALPSDGFSDRLLI
jgi:single-stranded DNA-binding protein